MVFTTTVTMHKYLNEVKGKKVHLDSLTMPGYLAGILSLGRRWHIPVHVTEQRGRFTEGMFLLASVSY